MFSLLLGYTPTRGSGVRSVQVRELVNFVEWFLLQAEEDVIGISRSSYVDVEG